MAAGQQRVPAPAIQGEDTPSASCITGQVRRYHPGTGLPTQHCGGIVVTVARARVCDYLGLTRLSRWGR